MAAIEKRVSDDNVTSYRVRVRLKGYPLQTSTFSRLTDAKRWAQETETAIRQGHYFKTSESKKHTLKKLIERYIQEGFIEQKNQKDKLRHLLWWKDNLGGYLLVDMSPALIAEYRNNLSSEIRCKGAQRSPATVARYLAALSHAFTIAVKEWGWLDSNPVLKVTKPKEPRGRVRFLSDNERARLLAACESSQNSYLNIVVVLALSTGMRQGEIMNLTWEDVDLKKGRITLHETKNGERRVVPLTTHTLKLLKAHSKIKYLGTKLLFPSHNASQTNKPMDLRKPWLTALKQANIEDFRFHDLRHSAASYLAMNGASIAEIAEVLGHKTLQMVKRYTHLSESHTAGVLEAMNQKIFGAAA